MYLAHQKVATARAKATARHAEFERPRLAQERNASRPEAHTREASRAKAAGDRAKADAERAQAEADRTRSEQAVSADDAEREARELQRQIDALEAEATDRGIVLTLGDILFATNSGEFQPGASRNLDQPLTFCVNIPSVRWRLRGIPITPVVLTTIASCRCSVPIAFATT